MLVVPLPPAFCFAKWNMKGTVNCLGANGESKREQRDMKVFLVTVVIFAHLLFDSAAMTAAEQKPLSAPHVFFSNTLIEEHGAKAIEMKPVSGEDNHFRIRNDLDVPICLPIFDLYFRQRAFSDLDAPWEDNLVHVTDGAKLAPELLLHEDMSKYERLFHTDPDLVKLFMFRVLTPGKTLDIETVSAKKFFGMPYVNVDPGFYRALYMVYGAECGRIRDKSPEDVAYSIHSGLTLIDEKPWILNLARELFDAFGGIVFWHAPLIEVTQDYISPE